MPSWSRIARLILGATVFATLALGPVQAETLHLNAHTLFDRAVSSNISLSPDGSTLELRSGEIIQDDGPASGFSYKPNKEKLAQGIAIRKQLVIADPWASKAILMVGSSDDLKVEVNGHPQNLGAPQSTFYGQWEEYKIDAGVLKPGLNDIVISGAGTVHIARADDSYAKLPHRSARSTDGGKNWRGTAWGRQGTLPESITSGCISSTTSPAVPCCCP